MIQPAMFALIRDGQTTLYSDNGGADLIARNLVWGHDALERWLTDRQPDHQFDTDCSAGAVVDFDAKALLWYTDDDVIGHPRSIQMLDSLIQTAWSDFEILYADGMPDLMIAAGDSISHANDRQIRIRADRFDPLESRCETMEDAVEFGEEFEPEDEYGRFAWFTILDHNDSIHQRLLSEITLDVIRNERAPLKRLMKMQSCDVPAEINVTEGMSIDEANKTIRLWGGRNITSVADAMRDGWIGWDIKCETSAGYDHQCQWSGPEGRPMTAVEALGSVVPILLMTDRIDPAMILGEIGKSFKRFVVKLVAF
ncbi:MAG: hypothetical protein KDB00_23625, partial [Planctomycetales bacterium]|nr:hypothetical protein [Planctomycetales bacterium]